MPCVGSERTVRFPVVGSIRKIGGGWVPRAGGRRREPAALTRSSPPGRTAMPAGATRLGPAPRPSPERMVRAGRRVDLEDGVGPEVGEQDRAGRQRPRQPGWQTPPGRTRGQYIRRTLTSLRMGSTPRTLESGRSVAGAVFSADAARCSLPIDTAPGGGEP